MSSRAYMARQILREGGHRVVGIERKVQQRGLKAGQQMAKVVAIFNGRHILKANAIEKYRQESLGRRQSSGALSGLEELGQVVALCKERLIAKPGSRHAKPRRKTSLVVVGAPKLELNLDKLLAFDRLLANLIQALQREVSIKVDGSLPVCLSIEEQIECAKDVGLAGVIAAGDVPLAVES